MSHDIKLAGWRSAQLWVMLVVLLSQPVWADSPDFLPERIAISVSDGVYRLDGQFKLRLSDHMQRALENGVPLLFDLDVDLYAQRRLVWDDHVASLKQRYRLSYHSLSKQYLVRNLNTDLQRSFPSLTAALRYMGQIKQLPLWDKHLLVSNERYLARIRFHLAQDALPVPLRVKAYFKKEWRASTPWIELRLTAAGEQ